MAGRRDELLPPELLDGLGDLEWVGRLVARGLGPGIHRSAFVGLGEDFEHHRPYQQGDDLRHLDWKLLARTDRLYVRRYRETTNLPTTFIIDASPSMDFAGVEEGSGGLTKLRFAALLVAALGRLGRNAGDLPGLAVTGGSGGEPLHLLPPRPGREAWHHFLHTLDTLEAGEASPLAPVLTRVGELGRRGGRIILLSDFLEEDGGRELWTQAGHLRARGDEVTAIRILTPDELGEGLEVDGLFADPEAPDAPVPGRPRGDEGYRERLSAYYTLLARNLEERGVQWWEARTTDPLLPLLRGWLRGQGPP
ncbi:MAG: DUF58 domain-containing protein [Gemmatimonadales bacterium]|nr:MAG: DUF58 domain-containing protein [Gemmatimonadales bacterium]